MSVQKTAFAETIRRAHDSGIHFVVIEDVAVGLHGSNYMTAEIEFAYKNETNDLPGIDSFEGLWERAAPMDLGGITVRVASLDDLIAMKRAANRTKDLLHLYELLALKKLMEERRAECPEE